MTIGLIILAIVAVLIASGWLYRALLRQFRS